jgi:Tryptophan RNA-binding attenuator protein inhibitory protein
VITETEPLMTKCFYREKGLVCGSGLLFNSVTLEPELLEGTSVYCPACEGRGVIPTNKGRELLAFLEKFGRPFLRDIVDELFEERER